MIPPSIDKHPMRCETCNQPHTDHLCETNGRKLRLSESDKEFLEIVGCASHSSNESLRAPNSSSLIAMAHQEWKNREERKPNAPNERDWCSGWMDGFLSVDKPYWSKERAEKILPEKPCDICLLNDLAANDYEKLKEHDRAIEQAAREKVLEEIQQWFKEHDCWKSEHGNYWTPVPFPASALMRFVESLRNPTTQKPANERDQP